MYPINKITILRDHREFPFDLDYYKNKEKLKINAFTNFWVELRYLNGTIAI